MVQQINLYDPTRKRRRQPLGSAHLGWALLALLGTTVAVSLSLHGLTVRERSLQRDAETELQALRLRGGPRTSPADRVAELERLRSLETARRQARRVLEQTRSARPGAPAGHGAAYFEALARKAHPELWITAFSVSADGQQLELAGRMQHSGILPAYLRSLNDEPLFRGRPFAQLDIRRPGPAGAAADGAGGVVEFTLRSQPARDEGRR